MISFVQGTYCLKFWYWERVPPRADGSASATPGKSPENWLVGLSKSEIKLQLDYPTNIWIKPTTFHNEVVVRSIFRIEIPRWLQSLVRRFFK